MALPGRIEDWLEGVPHLTSDAGWQTCMGTQHGNLCHCESPWTGALLRIRAEVHVEQWLENTAELFVHRELVAQHGNGDRFKLDSLVILEQHVAGEVLVEQSGEFWGSCSSVLLEKYCFLLLDSIG